MNLQCSIMQSPPGPRTLIDGQWYLYFSGTGYLGLQDHPEVMRATCEAARQYGLSSATSRASVGNTPPLLDLERLAAQFFGSEQSFYFASGYASDFILLSALAGEVDAVFVDERAYCCLNEAARLVRQPAFRFHHADPEALRASLHAELRPGQRPLVLSDGVFTAHGRIAPVIEYSAILQEYPGAVIMLDDAHGIGVLGENGRGTLEHLGLFREANLEIGPQSASQSPRLFFCGTLSKAIGGYGGIIPCSRGLMEQIKKTSNWFDAATPPPACVAAGTARAFELILADPGIRARLWSNVRLLKDGLRQMGVKTADTPVPIITFPLGNAANMERIFQQLKDRGIFLGRRPVSRFAPEGEFRLAVFASHTEEMIHELLDALRQAI